MLLFMLPCCSICATGRRSECRDRISQAAKLLVILARYHGGNETFVMAKPLATIGLEASRWYAARDYLEELSLIRCIHRGGRGPHDPPNHARPRSERHASFDLGRICRAVDGEQLREPRAGTIDPALDRPLYVADCLANRQIC